MLADAVVRVDILWLVNTWPGELEAACVFIVCFYFIAFGRYPENKMSPFFCFLLLQNPYIPVLRTTECVNTRNSLCHEAVLRFRRTAVSVNQGGAVIPYS